MPKKMAVFSIEMVVISIEYNDFSKKLTLINVLLKLLQYLNIQLKMS